LFAIDSFAAALAALSVDIFELLPAASDHGAVERAPQFAIEARPIFPFSAARKRRVAALENAVDVQIFVARRVGMIRVEASAEQQADQQANKARPAAAVRIAFFAHDPLTRGSGNFRFRICALAITS